MSSSTSCFFRGMLGACVVLLATAVIVPQYADYKERAATTQMFNESATLRQAVEARILELGGIQNSGTGVQVPPAGSYRANLMRDGIVILQGVAFGHVLVLSPAFHQGEVIWQCTGGPPKDMPRQCRDSE
jgi:hypothetical protein